MNRRQIVRALLALGAATTPLRVTAQTTKRDQPFRVATLPDFPNPIIRSWLSDDMRALGWTEGRDFVVVPSGVPFGQLQLDEAIRRLVTDKPDLVFVINLAPALALHRATPSIPIVMATSGYPVEAGLAESLARPGKNVTGNTVYAGVEIWGKLLQLLREAKPSVGRVSVLWTYVPPAYPREEIEPCYDELRNAEHALGVKVHIVEVANPDQVPGALTEIDAQRPDALLLTSQLPLKVNSTVMQFAVRNRLPTITDIAWSTMIEPYPLLCYGPLFRELVRSAATYIDKIFKGARPGDLPIQRPAKFEMVVNLKTAQAIGLTIPQELVLRADRVIE